MAITDFDTIVDRRGSGALKWDLAGEGVLPMWVADMDFNAADPIRKALSRRMEHGIFGYTLVSDKYYEAIINWFATRHGWKIEREWIVPVTGVIPALSAIIGTYAVKDRKVLLQGPVYNHFYITVDRNGCEAVSASLLRKGNTYEMDFEELERKASDPGVRMMLLCNPHNPAGRVWTPEELRRVGEICSRHGVLVASDEIHCELVAPGHSYTPFASLSGEFAANSVTCVSPTKPFNIAGLQVANMIIPNPEIRKKVLETAECREIDSPGIFGMEALVAAYTEGAEWIDALNAHVAGNFRYMKEYCAEHLPDFPLMDLQGTYLAWMDCSCLGIPSGRLSELLKSDASLWLMSGREYGEEGEGFMRWNLACPRVYLEEGLRRFAAFAESRK